MDLRNHFPRSMRVKMADHVHLARMIDKCRAMLAGTEGEYIYPCPMDDRLMEFAGITPDQFTAAVKANPSDDLVAKWFHASSSAGGCAFTVRVNHFATRSSDGLALTAAVN